jgi:hypothetical protein
LYCKALNNALNRASNSAINSTLSSAPFVDFAQPLHHLWQLTRLQRLSGNLHHTAAAAAAAATLPMVSNYC